MADLGCLAQPGDEPNHHFATYEKALKHQNATKVSLSRLSAALNALGLQDEHNLRTLISDTTDDLAKSQQATTALLELIPPEQRLTESAARVRQRVFDIPEMLERILSFLSLRDLLNVQQVNRQFFDSISASPKLKRQMCLLPDYNHHGIDLPFQCHIRGVYFWREVPGSTLGPVEPADPAADQESVPIQIRIAGVKHLSKLRLGSRVRSLLICQPPVKKLAAYVDCCDSPIGHLMDAAEQLLKVHHLCPHASRYYHNDDGSVMANATFEGQVKISSNNPTLVEHADMQKDYRERAEKRHLLFNVRLPPYITAKRAGKSDSCSTADLRWLLTSFRQPTTPERRFQPWQSSKLPTAR
jgi:hypothetical protein